MAEFRMPSLGADMDAGTVVEWFVKAGDVVRKGDIVAVVDTAKSDVEVETFVGGVVDQILVGTGQEVSVGTVLALISPTGAEVAAPAPPAAAPIPSAAVPGPPAVSPTFPAAPPPVPPLVTRGPVPAGHATSPLVRRLAKQLGVDFTRVVGTGEGGTITRADVAHAAAIPSVTPRVSPYARRLAHELGIDLRQVRGTGNGGIIRAADVRAAAEPAVPAGAPPTGPTAPASGGPTPAAAVPEVTAPVVAGRPEKDKQLAMREAIARLMSRAKREIPHYYLSTTVDLSKANGWLREQNRSLAISERLVSAALLLKATAAAASRHRELNGFWVDGAFAPAEAVHLGVAISLRGGGLVAPALHDAANLPVHDLMAALRDLVNRARAGRLRRTELADPTITVTNLGDQGVESVFGVIYPPQVALVGFGRVVERPWAADGMLGVRPVVALTLAADHRATDGFTGSRFLATIDELLQHPEAL